MTGRDRRLTARARSERAAAQATISSLHLRAQLAALERLGHDGEALLACAQLSRSALLDPDARFAESAHVAMLRAAQGARPLPNLALQLALHVPIGAYEVVDYLVTSSDTAGEGLHQLARYFRLISDRLQFAVSEQDGGFRLGITARDGGPAPRFGAEYSVALTLLNLTRATDARFSAVHASFAHALDDAAAFTHSLGCEVRTNQSWSGFFATRQAWSLPMPRRDPTLRRVLEHHARDLEDQLPHEAALESDVRRAVAALLPSGEVRISAVARRLGLTPRTLQRRLADRGQAFQALAEEVLRTLAERYLQDPRLSIGEVAYLLGYSEPSAFHRAFRRWSGETPQAYRKARLAPHAPKRRSSAH